MRASGAVVRDSATRNIIADLKNSYQKSYSVLGCDILDKGEEVEGLERHCGTLTVISSGGPDLKCKASSSSATRWMTTQ